VEGDWRGVIKNRPCVGVATEGDEAGGAGRELGRALAARTVQASQRTRAGEVGEQGTTCVGWCAWVEKKLYKVGAGRCEEYYLLGK
jgi:hypothetical protein